MADTVRMLLLILVVVPLYFAPSIIAHRKKHPRASLITVINIFLSPVFAFLVMLIPVGRSPIRPPEANELACPECGVPYSPSDYLPTATEWYCSSCKAALPMHAA